MTQGRPFQGQGGPGAPPSVYDLNRDIGLYGLDLHELAEDRAFAHVRIFADGLTFMGQTFHLLEAIPGQDDRVGR